MLRSGESLYGVGENGKRKDLKEENHFLTCIFLDANISHGLHLSSSFLLSIFLKRTHAADPGTVGSRRGLKPSEGLENSETWRTERPSLIILLHSRVFTGRGEALNALCYVGCTTQYLKSNPRRRSDDGEGDKERKT